MSLAPLRWHEVTAVFGGTFDPPHLGHQAAMEGLFSFPGVQRVLLLPCPTPPHKPSIATLDQRVQMARLAMKDFKNEVVLDLRELERPPGVPTYTFDTLTEMRREYPRLAFVIGTDQLQKISTWHRFPEVLELSHWIVLERKAAGTTPTLNALSQLVGSGLLRPTQVKSWSTRSGTTIQLVPTEAPRLSSTEIRESIALTGEPPQNSLNSDVLAYLKMHRIYGTRRTE